MLDQSNAKESLFLRNENPYGHSWEEWTIRWWNWLLSIPKKSNPALDTSGEQFNLETQNGNRDVIFLPGNLGGCSVRTYTVPSGRAILIPIINFTTSYSEEPNLKTELDLVNRANRDIDDIVEKFAEVDGQPIYNIEEFRVRTPPFGTCLISDNVFNVTPGQTTSVSDGYWIFLRPLSTGTHEIHTIGACSSGKTRVDSKLYLIVTEMP
jgi:hypothetical protein